MREAAAAAEVATNGRVSSDNADVEAGVQEVAKFGWIVGVLVRYAIGYSNYFELLFGFN